MMQTEHEARARGEVSAEEWAREEGVSGFAQLSALGMGAVALASAPFVSIGADVRLYYHAHGERTGFDFMAVEWATCDYPGTDFDGVNVGVTVLFHGLALFDGVRHLYFGHEASDNEGYLYYPDVSELAASLQALNALAREHTRMEEG